MRLIDADALIEKCGNWYVEEGTESGFIGTLKNLLAIQPTVQPETHWIPCSERLPETYGAYLVQDVCGGIFTNYWRGCWLAKTTMVAWMTLPEPYRGGDEDERNRIIEIGFAHFDDLLDGMEAEL